MNYKEFKVMAVMDTEDVKENPIIFDFNISGVDENSVGMTVSKMKSIYKIISIEETTPTKTGEIYKSDNI